MYFFCMTLSNNTLTTFQLCQVTFTDLRQVELLPLPSSCISLSSMLASFSVHLSISQFNWCWAGSFIICNQFTNINFNQPLGKIEFQSPQEIKQPSIYLQLKIQSINNKFELLNIQTFLSSFSSILLTMTSSVMSAREVMTFAGGSSCSTLFFFFWKSQNEVNLVIAKFFDSK